MQGRTEFIQTISKALGRGDGNPADADIFTTTASHEQEAVLARIKARLPAEKKQMRGVIDQVAGPLHIDFHPEENLQDIAGAIGRLIRDKDPEWGTEKSVVRWDHPLLNRLNLESLPELDGVTIHTTHTTEARKGEQAAENLSPMQQAAVKEKVEASFIGITSADYLVAATATLAMRSRPGHARSVSLVPAIHIVVIEEEKLLANLEELYTLLKWDPKERALGLTNCLSLVSGPSKTGDIELIMVHGAHGPRELHLFVVAGEGA